MMVRLSRAVFLFRMALLERLGQQAPFGSTHYHEAAVGLRENIEQAVEHLRQNVFDRRCPAQVLRDFDQRPQLRLRIHGQSRRFHAGRQSRASKASVLLWRT